VIVDAQTALLEGAIKAGVPRFIPSDYSIDFTKFPAGQNRNLDLRREFHERLDRAKISATTIFNGAFADMLATGQMPVILFKLRRVTYWAMPISAWTSRQWTIRPLSRRGRRWMPTHHAFCESLAISQRP